MSGVIGVIAIGYVVGAMLLGILFVLVVDELDERWEFTCQERQGVHIVITVLWPLTLLIGLGIGMVALCRLFGDAAQGVASLVRRIRARRVPRATARRRGDP